MSELSHRLYISYCSVFLRLLLSHCIRFCLNCPDFDIILLQLDLIVNQFTFCGASALKANKANPPNSSSSSNSSSSFTRHTNELVCLFGIPVHVPLGDLLSQISWLFWCGTLLLLIAWHNCSDSIEIYGRCKHGQIESRDVSKLGIGYDQLKAYYDNIT